MAGKLPPRGILGVRKDPKKQILFSFKARQGEEWPETDSDDSDYLPSDGAAIPPGGRPSQTRFILCYMFFKRGGYLNDEESLFSGIFCFSPMYCERFDCTCHYFFFQLARYLNS